VKRETQTHGKNDRNDNNRVHHWCITGTASGGIAS
jgi:hypothetical protein